MKKLLWITPEESGGIRSYANSLWPAVRAEWEKQPDHKVLEPLYETPSAAELEELAPDVIHIQHEFGLFGSKIPGFYNFPRWVRAARLALPRAKIYATAHSVLGPQYRYPWRATGWQRVIRQAVNLLLVPMMRDTWLRRTWGPLDGVIVHSSSQVGIVRATGCQKVAEIPHFVFQHQEVPLRFKPEIPEVLLFGYVSLEKGQDIAIRALAQVKAPCKLIIAGGIRRDADVGYFARCERLIDKLGLSGRVQITGYVENADVEEFYQRATLVLAPFRETSGSGTLAQALSRRAAILTSDLPLNREINDRQKDCVAFFKSEDAADCARQMDELLSNPEARTQLKKNALAYAESHSIAKTAEKHMEFYQ